MRHVSLTVLCRDLPHPRHGHTHTGLTVCGGGEGDVTRRSCVTWRGGDWVTSHHLLYSRIYHSSWDSPLGILLLGGTSASTAELLHQNGTTTILFYLIDNLR